MSFPGVSLIPRGLPLPIHAPRAPDSFLCNAIYGQNIVPSFCQNLVDTHWPSGNAPIPLFLQDPAPSNAIRLPYTVRDPGCAVSIEAAGPNTGNVHYLTASPNLLRGLAGYLIQKCPVEFYGNGGFVSFGMMDVQTFITEWGMRVNSIDQNESGRFLTISVYGNNRNELRPGDTDPSIAGLLSVIAATRVHRWIPWSSVRKAASQLAQFLHYRAIEMYSGSNLTWWDGLSEIRAQQAIVQETTTTDSPKTDSGKTVTADSGRTVTTVSKEAVTTDSESTVTTDSERTDTADSGITWTSDTSGRSDSSRSANAIDAQDPEDQEDSGNMTYECDSSLGTAPEPTDCEKLSWSGLKPPGSIETLQAQVPKFYTQGTCTLGISSTFPTTVTWAHLLAAFDTLYNLCVQNPILRAKGGRAYYGKQAINSWINGKRDTVDGVSGLEALPPGINATIFRHNSKSSISCEWALAQEGKDITMCEGV